MVVTVDPQHVSTLTTGVVILSQKRKVELAFSATRTSQCRNCGRYGHTHERCPATHPTCPICALHHTRAAHRCQNPSCPSSGNHKPVPSCCPTSPPYCCNCGNDHTATFRECPARPVPTVPTRPTSPAPAGQDPMDMAVDGGQTPATPPARQGPTEVDLVTPRQHPRQVPSGVPELPKASVVLSPWRNLALPLLLSIVGLVPIMINKPSFVGNGPAPVSPPLSIVQHNSLGSCDVFLSLFHNFTMLGHPPLLVAIQDPPSRRSVLPTFPGFMSFDPPHLVAHG